MSDTLPCRVRFALESFIDHRSNGRAITVESFCRMQRGYLTPPEIASLATHCREYLRLGEMLYPTNQPEEAEASC